MKHVKIIRFTDAFASGCRQKLILAAKSLSERTGYSVEWTPDGFEVSGYWQNKFQTEYAFAARIARDLALEAGVPFESLIE